VPTSPRHPDSTGWIDRHRAFDKKTSGMPIVEKVDGKVLSVTMKFIAGIRQERISDVVFVRLVNDVASSYRLTDLGRLES
jgi:hypothetical protein